MIQRTGNFTARSRTLECARGARSRPEEQFAREREQRAEPFQITSGGPYTYQQHYDSFFGPVEARSPGQVITATQRAALVKPAARAAPP